LAQRRVLVAASAARQRCVAMGSPGEEAMDAASEVERLRRQVEVLTEEKDRLAEQVKDLTRRCQKLAAVAAQPEPELVAVATQTEDEDAAEGESAIASAEAASRLPPPVQQMLKSPQDESAQLQGIEALFQQAQVDGATGAMAAPALQVSVEAAVAIFSNHPTNYPLLLKASHFLSVLFAEPNVQQQLPLERLFKAARSVTAASVRLLAAAPMAEGGAAGGKAGAPTPSKLMGWFLSLLALLLPCIGPRLRDREQGEPFARDLLGELVSKLLSAAEVPQEALLLKCVQLLPLLPMEPWIQTVCLDSGAAHSLAFAYHRCASTSAAGREAPVPKAIRAAVRGVFADNLELCVRAVDEVFASDEFVCLEILDELQGMEKKKRGTLRTLDSDFGFVGKALGLWAFHQRRALEDADPQKSTSREVLQKVSELLTAVLLKIPPHVFLQRMQEFQADEVLQRHALAAVHATPQLRLQLAVNYVDNSIIPVAIGGIQMLLRHFECAAPGVSPPVSDVEAAFRLLRNGLPPADGWPYVLYSLDICLHVLSHWSATKLSMQQKADVLDGHSAPLLLAKGGLVDILAELMDPVAAGVELSSKPPAGVMQKANETLQALFERNGHICLFCMQHYSEVKQMVSMGSDSLALDPLKDFPQMQQQAVGQLIVSYEKFSVGDDRISRKIMKALTALFESSYHLVAWFLQNNPLSSVGEYQSLDVHVEAVRAIIRAAYWSSEDAPLLPEFVSLLAQLILGSIEGHGDEVPGAKPPARVVDLTEAEQVAAACMASLLHLLLIDPSPPTVLHCLARSLSDYGKAAGDSAQPAEEVESSVGSERAVNAVMKVMQVFPSSDRIQLDCHHLLTSLLGE